MRFTVLSLMLLVSACVVPEPEQSSPAVIADTATVPASTTNPPLTTSVSSSTSTTAATVPESATTVVVSEPTAPSPSVEAVLITPEQEGGYDRKLFKHWSDLDKDGCDTRREVLIEESRTPVTVGSGCSITGGSWYSAFDGTETMDPSKFDVDHMVPLKEAWDSGAWEWSPEQRQAFANDMSIPESLIAVSASSNRSKGARDPAEWLPPRQEFHCQYVDAWIEVKKLWNLSMDQAEHDAIAEVRANC